MDAREFLDNFEHIASAPNGVQRLRDLILQLAVRGRLVGQAESNEPVGVLIDLKEEKARLLRERKIKKPKSLAAIRPYEKPFKIPTNWEWLRLGQTVNQITGGGTPSKSNPTYWNGAIPWASVKDLKGRYINETIDAITENGLKNSSASFVPKGNVIACTRMGLGKVAINRIDLAINQDLKALWLSSHIDVEYFVYAYQTFEMKGKGTTVRGIRQDQLLNFLIPIPPRQEQKRIANKVSELMTFCDQLEALQMQLTETRQKANRAALGELVNAITCSELERAWSRIDLGYKSLFSLRDCINDVKETVMDLAVQGKLSRQRTDEVAAHELLKNIREERKLHGGNRSQSKPMLTDVSAKYPVPSNWTTCRANELGLFITSGSRGWAKYYSSGGAWFIRIGNLSYQNTQIDPGNIQYVNPPEGSEGTRTRVEAGDILISITGDTGMVGIVPSDVQEAYINQHICLFRPSRLIDHEYLALMFRSRMGLRQLHKLQKGIKNSLSLQDVRDILINLPPRLEQSRIVTQTKRLLELCDQLKSRLSTLTLIHEKLSAGSVGFVLGMTKQVAETIRTEEKEKSFLKVPEVFLRLVAKMKKQLTETVLAKLLNQHGKSMEARELWQKSGLTIDEFYATLKREITEGFIAEPEVARLKFVEVVD